MNYNTTLVDSDASGPNGNAALTTAHNTATSPQPIGHYLNGWAPGEWGLLGESIQYNLVNDNITFNPSLGQCGAVIILP